MIYKHEEKVIIRIKGKVLQFGDIAFITHIDYARLIDTYFCECPLSGRSEWMAPQHFDKYQERPPNKAPVYDRIKNAAKDIDAEKKGIVRPPPIYDNKRSSYKYDEE